MTDNLKYLYSELLTNKKAEITKITKGQKTIGSHYIWLKNAEDKTAIIHLWDNANVQ